MALVGALIQAADDGDVARVRQLAAQGADVNQRDGDGWTALHVAAQNGHVEVTSALITLGVNKEAQLPTNGWRPLHVAAVYGQVEVIKTLVASQGGKGCCWMEATARRGILWLRGGGEGAPAARRRAKGTGYCWVHGTRAQPSRRSSADGRGARGSRAEPECRGDCDHNAGGRVCGVRRQQQPLRHSLHEVLALQGCEVLQRALSAHALAGSQGELRGGDGGSSAGSSRR